MLLITVVLGTLLALLLDQPIFGQGIVRLMVIAPFFIMPTVVGAGLEEPADEPGVRASSPGSPNRSGFAPIDWFAQAPMLSVILIVAWEWTPFATLIIFTALQSLDLEQKEAAEMDGAPPLSFFSWIVLPHLARPITVVIMIETIFLLSVFAEIRVTTDGGPGQATTNLAYLVFQQAILNSNVGAASAGGIVAVVLANIVAFFLVRVVGKNLDA